jgi:hypothetical protein
MIRKSELQEGAGAAVPAFVLRHSGVFTNNTKDFGQNSTDATPRLRQHRSGSRREMELHPGRQPGKMASVQLQKTANPINCGGHVI